MNDYEKTLLAMKGVLFDLPQDQRIVFDETLASLREVYRKAEQQHEGLGVIAVGYLAAEVGNEVDK